MIGSGSGTGAGSGAGVGSGSGAGVGACSTLLCPPQPAKQHDIIIDAKNVSLNFIMTAILFVQRENISLIT